MNKQAAVAIVRDGDHILTVWNRAYQCWSLPGGKVEEGESPGQAHVRELEEETGIRAMYSRLVCTTKSVVEPEREVSVYEVTRWCGDAREIEAGCPVEWMTKEDLIAKSPFAESYRECL